MQVIAAARNSDDDHQLMPVWEMFVWAGAAFFVAVILA